MPAVIQELEPQAIQQTLEQPLEQTDAQKNDNPRKSKKRKPKVNQKPEKIFAIKNIDNSRFRCLGSWPSLEESPIDWPPTVPVNTKSFPNASFPDGETVEYTDANSFRMTSAEKRALETPMTRDLNDIRRASEVHRQVRKYVQSWIEPGMKMIDICQKLEAKTLELVQADGAKSGFGFPTGCSLNHVAAHYTPNYGDDTVLQYSDIMKLDFGVHVNGLIVDSAFTVAFDPKFDSLIESTLEATKVGIAAAGIDVRFYEVSKAIEEVIKSYEMEVDGKLVPIKPIANLNGHTITRWQIHGGKSVPIVNTGSMIKMEEGEIYAIETFASTGKGVVAEGGECSHYRIGDFGPIAPRGKQQQGNKTSLLMRQSLRPAAQALLSAIEANFGSLAFCRRWLDDIQQTRHLLSLKQLVQAGVITDYPPLVDVKGSFTSQSEHTLILRPTCKEILSRGPDY